MTYTYALHPLTFEDAWLSHVRSNDLRLVYVPVRTDISFSPKAASLIIELIPLQSLGMMRREVAMARLFALIAHPLSEQMIF